MKLNNLINPFEQVAEKKLLAIGIIAALVTVFICYFNQVLFRGSLQLVNDYPKSWYICLVNIGINLMAHIVLIYSVAKLRYNKTRFIDVLAVVLFSHVATSILGIITTIPFFDHAIKELGFAVLDNGFSVETFPKSLLLIVGLFAMLSICLLILFFYWLVVGFKVVTNSKNKFDGLLIIILVLLLNISLQIINPYL